jgi:hypothetical protein
MTEIANAKGCSLGLACGDALGRPVEFKSAEEIASQHGEVTEMLGHGTHGQPPGTITDDTEMALCIAESLVDRRGFDPADVADRFVDWLDSDPFDIGLMTRDSLSQIRQGTSQDDAGEALLRSNESGGYGSPAEIEAAFDISIADHPRAVYEVAEICPQLASGTSAILDYLTQLRLPQQQRTLTDTSPEAQLTDLRDIAHTVVGELHVMYESLRRVAVRHPEIEHEQWQASTTPSGGR